jgi:tight adherence protein C
MILQGLMLILGLLFATCLALTLRAWLAERRQRAAEDVASPHAVPRDHARDLLLGKLTPALAGQAPMAQTRQAVMGRELREAGFYHRGALLEYLAVRALLILAPLLVGGTITVLAPRENMPTAAAITLLATGLGFSLPRLYVNTRARWRARQIERGLPLAVDLLTLGLSAGQTIQAALDAICQRLRPSYPILAAELAIVREHADLSNLPLALRQFAERTNVPDVGNLAMVLSQAERLGTDVSQGLLEFSNNLRTNLRHRAEAQANRANFWMLPPTIVCLWAPAAMLLVLPVYHDFSRRRAETREILTKESETLRQIERESAERFRTSRGTTEQ